MPFALHAAYWHDRFGEPKSGGCVNLSVRDAKWLFDWTAPCAPETWHSVRSSGAAARSRRTSVHGHRERAQARQAELPEQRRGHARRDKGGQLEVWTR
ncbi:MAG: L,D-transpeptidase [Polyangiaceae bacterium]|nr:L,D-transpeptidase [Polyangiaceae bacterium]